MGKPLLTRSFLKDEKKIFANLSIVWPFRDFSQLCDFFSQFRDYWPISWFFTNFVIFYQFRDFWPISWFVINLAMFCQFWQYIWILANCEIFFVANYAIFINYAIFCPISRFWPISPVLANLEIISQLQDVFKPITRFLANFPIGPTSNFTYFANSRLDFERSFP